jgi:hypothetical protein
MRISARGVSGYSVPLRETKHTILDTKISARNPGDDMSIPSSFKRYMKSRLTAADYGENIKRKLFIQIYLT